MEEAAFHELEGYLPEEAGKEMALGMGCHQHARHGAGAGSRVLPGNLSLSATFGSLMSPLWQRLEGCEGRADEVMVVLIGSFGGETLFIGVQVPGKAPGCCLGRGVLLHFWFEEVAKHRRN